MCGNCGCTYEKGFAAHPFLGLLPPRNTCTVLRIGVDPGNEAARVSRSCTWNSPVPPAPDESGINDVRKENPR